MKDDRKKLLSKIAELESEIEKLKQKVRIKQPADKPSEFDQDLFQKTFTLHSVSKLLIEPGTGRIVSANKAAEDFYGYTNEQLTDKTIYDINIAPGSEVKKRMEEVSHRDLLTIDFQHKLSDGTLKDVRVHSSPIDLDGKTMLLSYIFDITEQKEVERALKQSEKEKADIVNNLAAGLYIYDLNLGTNIYINPTYTKITGWTLDELNSCKDNFFDLFHPEDHEVLAAHMQRLKDSTEDITDILEYRFKHKEGHWIWCLSYDTPIKRDESGKAMQFVGSFTDVTERRNYENEVNKLNKTLQSAQDVAKIGYWEYDVESQQPEWSDGLFRILGQDPAKGVPLFEDHKKIIHPDDWELYSRSVEESIMGKPYSIVIRFIHENGDVHYIHTSGFPQKIVNGKVVKLLGTAQDITELKMNELKLQELNATKDKLFSIISHDLRNPIHAIMNSGELLMNVCKNSENPDIERITKLSTLISSSAEHAFNKLIDLLDWARVQNGTIQFRPTVIYPEVIIDSSVKRYRAAAEAKNIKIDKSISASEPIKADGKMLSSILDNLISNAVKFTEPGGEVTVSAAREGDSYLFTVSDTGKGISEQKLEKLFSIGENTSTKGTGGEEGTGLGLILCREFTEKHNGSISVESAEGEGSTFYVAIPAISD